MFVLTQNAIETPNGFVPAGSVVEIPREFYTPATMMRLGTDLTADQQKALVRWGAWPTPIHGE